MEESYLTLTQSICSARIFLNAFGLILDDDVDINGSSQLNINDKSMNTVGKLYFDGDKVLIFAEYDDCVLEANYDIPKISGFVDKEWNDALFAQWNSDIVFKFSNNIMNLEGKFFMGCSMDSELGVNCTCHPIINFEVPDGKKMTLKILRDGKTFGVDIENNSYKEVIEITPYGFGVYMCHDITDGKYNKETCCYPYKMRAVIRDAAEVGKEKEKLRIFLIEKEYQNKLVYHDEIIPKAGENSLELTVQKGLLMKKLDPKMYEKINQLKKLFLVGDISLLDNLFSICYDGCTDEELEALLGIRRTKMIYQDGANSLAESYFGTSEKSQFSYVDVSKSKKLLRNNKQNN